MEEEVKISRMDEGTWETGLKGWACLDCDISILEEEINKKPDAKCPLCGNPNLVRQND